VHSKQPEQSQVGDARFLAILEEIKSMHCRKGADYGTAKDTFANVRASEEFGVPAWQGAVLRANDKMARLKTFCIKGSLVNESVEDSLLDLANYAVIALRLYREAYDIEPLHLPKTGD
jgi:hypothetical protein